MAASPKANNNQRGKEAMTRLDNNLIKMAMWRLKQGFVPSDGAAGGGGPPPDAGGGAPPPPGDPGGAPPPDAGGPPPGGDPGGSTPMPPPEPPPAPAGGGDIAAQVTTGVQQALMQSGLQGNKGPTAPKPDINTVATDVFQLKKMLLHYFRMQGIELPPDILDGPNRDPVTGAPAPGTAGGSDAQPGSSMQGAGGASAIKPIQPMAGAFPPGGGGGGAGGGMGKMGGAHLGEGITSQRVISKAAATAMLLKRQRIGA